MAAAENQNSPTPGFELNPEMANAWEFAEHTSVSIFLTGRAGTGKTTFLRFLRKNSSKAMVVVAPTGVAAINAGGQTIHSLFQLPLSPYVPGTPLTEQGFHGMAKNKLRILRGIDMLVIDEISMVRADLLDAVDAALRKYRRNDRPFGGVQLLMIGDLQQLAPVTTPSDEAILRDLYPTPYFFGSKALAKISYVTISLTKVYRQHNQRFVDLLNHVRDKRLTESDVRELNSRLDPNFRPSPKSDFIRLTTHNAMADSYNARSLAALSGRPARFKATVQGVFPEGAYPTAEELVLKPGAQVMFLRNDPQGRFFNGKIGHVVEVRQNMVKVACEGQPLPIEVEPHEWENAKYTVNPSTNSIETEVQGRFTQLPLRLAWAVTIHKSQGLTFDHVVIDAGAAFAPGQVYVALSRCTSLEGIVLATPINAASLGSDLAVDQYIATQDTAAEASLQALDSLRQDYLRQTLLDLFNFTDVFSAETQLQRHIYQIFRRMFPAESRAHVAALDTLREKVLDVADKWRMQLTAMPVADLKADPTLERVKRGCEYFAETLRSTLASLLADTARVRSNNQRANLRLQELHEELRQALAARCLLLLAVARDGFSVATYLHHKQQAWMQATKDTSAPTKRTPIRASSASRQVSEPDTPYVKTRKEPKKAKEKPARAFKPAKEPKEPSHAVSLRLFRQGLTREEIAEKVGLKPGTITGHLVRYIDSGELDISDLFPPVVLNQVNSVLDTIAEGDNRYEICCQRLPDIPYSDILIIARHRPQ